MAQIRRENKQTAFRKWDKKTLLETGKDATKQELMLPGRRKALENAFFEAARTGNYKDIGLFLDAGVNIESRNSDGSTALIYAVNRGLRDSCAFLLSKGANIEATGYDGMTALMYAALNDNVDLCVFLLDKGANVNARDKEGRTALRLIKDTKLRYKVKEFLERYALRRLFGMDEIMAGFFSNFKECI